MAKPIMLQGTMSNVGKSFLTAALCRIFRQDGYSPAPFKSQNMALNSFITADGLEIGRAQAMQAQAAGLKPSVWMNPILLKPTTDVGSQVIVNGKVWRNMSAIWASCMPSQSKGVTQKVAAMAMSGLQARIFSATASGARSSARRYSTHEDCPERALRFRSSRKEPGRCVTTKK